MISKELKSKIFRIVKNGKEGLKAEFGFGYKVVMIDYVFNFLDDSEVISESGIGRASEIISYIKSVV